MSEPRIPIKTPPFGKIEWENDVFYVPYIDEGPSGWVYVPDPYATKKFVRFGRGNPGREAASEWLRQLLVDAWDKHDPSTVIFPEREIEPHHDGWYISWKTEYGVETMTIGTGWREGEYERAPYMWLSDPKRHAGISDTILAQFPVDEAIKKRFPAAQIPEGITEVQPSVSTEPEEWVREERAAHAANQPYLLLTGSVRLLDPQVFSDTVDRAMLECKNLVQVLRYRGVGFTVYTTGNGENRRVESVYLNVENSVNYIDGDEYPSNHRIEFRNGTATVRCSFADDEEKWLEHQRRTMADFLTELEQEEAAEPQWNTFTIPVTKENQ